jgi:soluble lytic murein transglycosylase
MLVLFSLASVAAPPAQAQAAESAGADMLLDARDALRKKDRSRLASAKVALAAAQHPLAMWADYWELSNRLAESSQAELNDFYARWPDTYVQDRLRNDWLLELGKRRDWANFAAEYPKFKFDDDREVHCYATLLKHLAGEDVRTRARALWFAQREFDDGCTLLATTLIESGRLTAADAWTKARVATEANRKSAARHAAGLVSDSSAAAVNELFDSPVRYLAKRTETDSRTGAELVALALIRLAASDPSAAAAQIDERWGAALPPPAMAWAWAAIGKSAAGKLMTQADGWYHRAATVHRGSGVELPDDTLAWKVRAALRADMAGNGEAMAARWRRVIDAVDAMSEAGQRDTGWTYWKARGLLATAPEGEAGQAQRTQAGDLLEAAARQLNFYGKLAAEELGRAQALPPKPAALTDEERTRAQQHPGLTRALALIGIGLRSEGVREWNFSLLGMSDRELLAAAQRACDREVWDRCINTSDRTRGEIDMAQRFPTPFRREVEAAAQEASLDAAYVYGLIRQESRFVLDTRSHAGASGLMQLMPATARWTARQIGLPYSGDMITDKQTNLRLGTTYLKLVLDDFGGSQALAAAAYNAGPNRPRAWREGPLMEVAAWAENIPFSETRDYVKKVLSNATYYAAVMNGRALSIKSRMPAAVGPRTADAPPDNRELP